MAGEAFRFLDLSIELRYMVYECIPIVTRHHTYHPPNLAMFGVKISITLVTKTLACSILATCHSIHDEAVSIFSSRLATIHAKPLLLIVDHNAADRCKALVDLMAKHAKQVILTPSPTPPPLPPRSSTLDSFAQKCVSYLSYNASPHAPTTQTRDLLVSLANRSHNLSVAVGSYDNVALMARIVKGLRRFVAGTCVAIVNRCAEDGALNIRGYEICLGIRPRGGIADWYDCEAWREEWGEGEAV